MKRITFLFLSAFISLGIYAQETTEESEDYKPKENKNAIGVSGGLGYGFDYSRKLSDKLFITLGYNALPVEQEDLEFELDGQDLLADVTVDFANVDLKLSYHPFGNAFKLVAGAGYFTASRLNLNSRFAESTFVGEIEFTTDDIGEIDIDFNWSEVAPYIGIGFGRPVSKKGLGFAFNAGTYYSESPEITLVATNILEPTSDQEGLLNESFESFQFIPYITFRLSYSF